MAKIIKAADNPYCYTTISAMDYELTEFSHQPTTGFVCVEPAAPVIEKTKEELLLERAMQKAAIIINTAESEVKSMYEQAQEEGYRAGLAQAQAEAQQHTQQIDQQVSQLISQLEMAITQAQQDRKDLIDSVEPAVVRLVLDSVEKIVRHEVKIDPRVVLRNIKACLRRIKDVHEVTVRVNPSELEFVKSQREELVSCSECIHNVALVDDRRVGAGGCIVESNSGDFDATIDTQLERVRNKILEIAADASDTDSES